MLGFLRSVSARKLVGVLLFALGAEQLHRAGLIQRRSQQPIVGHAPLSDATQSGEASAHNCFTYELCASLVVQLIGDQRGATSSVATAHTHSAPVVFGGPSSAGALFNKPSISSTAVAIVYQDGISDKPNTHKWTGEGVRPASLTLDEPSPRTEDGPTSATVDGKWTIIDVGVYFGPGAEDRLEVRVQGLTSMERPSDERLTQRYLWNLDTGVVLDAGYVRYEKGRELPPKRKPVPFTVLHMGPDGAGEGSGTGTTGAAGSTGGTKGAADIIAGATGAAGSTAGSTGAADSTAGATGTIGAGESTAVATVYSFSIFTDSSSVQLHASVESPTSRLPGSTPSASPAAQGLCVAPHPLAPFDFSLAGTDSRSSRIGRQHVDQLVMKAASIFKGLRLRCWAAAKHLIRWATDPLTLILLAVVLFKELMLYEACVERLQARRVADEHVRASHALARDLYVTQKSFEDADADAFKNMPKPETFWRLPVRTPEEVAALRRTNFLGFLQETSTAAMHRLWFCIKSAPGVSYMRIKLMCRFCFIRIKPAYFFVTDYVRLLVSKLPLGAAARLVACARFPLNWVQTDGADVTAPAHAGEMPVEGVLTARRNAEPPSPVATKTPRRLASGQQENQPPTSINSPGGAGLAVPTAEALGDATNRRGAGTRRTLLHMR